MPRVVLCQTLKELNATLELRGKDIETLKRMLQEKENSQTLEYLRKSPYGDWPPLGELEKSIKLFNDKELSILIKTSEPINHKHNLHLVSFPEEYHGDILKSSASWKIHPDGVGFYHKWAPSMGPTIVLTGDYQKIGKQVEDLNRSARKRCDSLREKVKLGEISEGAYILNRSSIRRETYEELKKLALLN